MSKLSRYNLLISLVRSELGCKHSLGTTTEAQSHNDMLTHKTVEAWIFLMEDLMCENEISVQARDTRIRNVIKYVNTHHISLTLSYLKDIYDQLIGHISGKNVYSCFDDFKGHQPYWDRDSIGLLISPIKESLRTVIDTQTVVSRGVYISSGKRDMWICAHYLQFLNKINYKDVGLEDAALADYLTAELETADMDLSSCKPYIPALQSIIKDWMCDWDYDGLRPKHGPGSVADTQQNKLSKYLALSSDELTVYLLKEETDKIMPFWHRQTFDRCSKLVFVPKNFTKLRSISMEPATLQYLQQGCMHSLYNYFEVQPQLRQVLKLANQGHNKSFAYHGSITNDYATIDLSHASDSVNWELVKCLVRRVPKLLKWLVCTRSTHTLLPTGQTIKLKKFAPMGSALCFPIESLVFAAIAKLSILLSREASQDRDNESGLRSNLHTFTVYGDDIIIPSYAANECVRLLQLFGFTPNYEKSYLSGPFKESCGGNYYCGYDITAIKYAPTFEEGYEMNVSPQAYTALCSYANLAYERGLFLFRLYCIKSIFEAGLKPAFCDTLAQSPKIFSPQPTNFHLRRVYSKRYQKYLYEYTGVKTVQDHKGMFDDLDEEIFLFDRLLLLDQRKEIRHLPSINAVIHHGVLQFDVESPYSRGTLLPQLLKFSLCKTDETSIGALE